MAECYSFTANLEELVTCCICNDILNIPKQLQCLHTFCLPCLEGWYKQCKTDRKPFNCPSCRTPMRVEADDVNNLPTSFHHNSLIEFYNTIKDKKTGDQQQLLPCFSCSNHSVVVGFCFQCEGMLCDECFKAHHTMKSFKETHQATLWSEFNKETISSYIDYKSLCQEQYHEKYHLEYYCQPCKKTICQKCATTAHSNHDKVSLEEASEQSQQRLKQEKHRLHKVVEMHENEHKLSCENRERIHNQTNETDAKLLDDLQATIKIMQDKADNYRAILRQYLDNQTKDNDEEKSAINDKLEQARSLRDQCEKMENLNLKQFILNGHEKLEEVCQTTVKGTPILPTRPVKRYSNMFYIPNPEALRILKDLELGKIIESMTEPSRCTIESVLNARCGFMNQFNIITRDAKGNECYTDEALIDVQIQDSDGNHVNKEITQSQPGIYTVKFKASKPSPYKLEVSIGGTPVSNSPQVVQTIEATAELKPVKVFKTAKARYPRTIALHDSCLIAVSYYSEKSPSVVLYNADGEFLRDVGGEGAAGEARLHDSRGVAFTNDDHVVVSDYHDEHGMIKLYDINGNYKRMIIKEKGKRFTRMCTRNQTIACLAYDTNSDETLIKLFSKQSCDHIQDIKLDIHGVGLPRHVAYDNNKYFLIFYDSTSVHVFNMNGALLNSFGEKGNNKGQFSDPRGLAVFGCDMLVVCDLDNNRVQLWHQDGRYITSFGTRGSGLGQMKQPIDVAVTPDDQVLVLEWDGKRVQVFI